MPDPELLAVTQEDRDAAAEYVRLVGWAPGCIDAIRSGDRDAMPSVQAFARHRTRPSSTEARLRTALQHTREAIASLPEYALGEGEIDTGFSVERYPLRDELLSNIDRALATKEAGQ